MPTGYTAPIKEGISFEEFVWGCARSFGALILMRDDPTDAPIPEFKPSEYHANALVEARAELARLNAMTSEEADAEALREHANFVAERGRWQKDSDELRSKYEAMLAAAKAWKPPTANHAGLKEFMVSQIEESIRFDCHDYSTDMQSKPQSGEEWLSERIGQATDRIGRYAKENEEEIARANSRNSWVKQLHASVPMPRKLSTPTPD